MPDKRSTNPKEVVRDRTVQDDDEQMLSSMRKEGTETSYYEGYRGMMKLSTKLWRTSHYLHTGQGSRTHIRRG